MGKPVTADELLKMAMEMERIGRDFYLTLGPACDRTEVTRICAALARQEAEHRETFQKMRRSLLGAKADKATALSDATAAAELMRRQILPTPQEVRKVALGGRLLDALDMAIQMEKGAIAFYGRMVELVPGQADAVSPILQAERSHLQQLLDIKRKVDREANAQGRGKPTAKDHKEKLA